MLGQRHRNRTCWFPECWGLGHGCQLRLLISASGTSQTLHTLVAECSTPLIQQCSGGCGSVLPLEHSGGVMGVWFAVLSLGKPAWWRPRGSECGDRLCFHCSSFRFQSFESYDSRPCLPEHNPYRPSYGYNYDFDLGPDRNGGFGGQYSDCRDPARERGSLDSFMRGRGQGRFQDRSNPSTFMRSEPFMPPQASSEPLSAPWTELNYVGGRGLGGPSPSRPPPSLFSQSMAPDFGVMGMQGVGSYDSSLPYGCVRSQTRMRDRVSPCQVLMCCLCFSF